ncbi:MAG: CHASE2 domain-containing protein [Cyanobacteria bacterium P01_C01_bin.147]
MADTKETKIAWKQLSKAGWQRHSLPGITVILLIVGLRLLGMFQELEWRTLDTFLRWRPDEPVDERLLIVGIDEADIQAIGTYPVPDADLAQLVDTLSADEPRAIGIDIFRDLPVEPGHAQLSEQFANNERLFAIEKIVGQAIAPPPAAPNEQVGFADFPLDADGFVRRTFLGMFPPVDHPEPDTFHFSLPLVLAQSYLASEGLSLGNGQRNSNNMAFGDRELATFQAHDGGYVGTNASGVQMLINVRSGPAPFEIVSLQDVMAGRVAASQIRDRVVLVGVMSLSNKDLVNSAAVDAANPGLFFGIEMHAHVTSQILSAVLDDRPLITVWSDGWEIFWMVWWGGIGMLLVRMVPRPTGYVLTVILVGAGLVALSFGLLWQMGWWLPVVPALTAFAINGVILPGFYLYDQTLRSRIAERQRVIEGTYDAIHNGPLQTLALVLKQGDRLDSELSTQLTSLNQELRTVYQRLQQEALSPEDQLQLGNQKVIDIRQALHEVLYEVYVETMQRDFPGFDSIKFQVVKFEPMYEQGLTMDERRSLCRLLEEMLLNVGKHAVNAKRLTVACYANDTDNLIQVADNGKGAPLAPPDKLSSAAKTSPSKGRGTQQAQLLAQRLGGTYERSLAATGTHCELRWPGLKTRWWRQQFSPLQLIPLGK